MPELPEVTVIVNSLNKVLKGLVLESVETDWPKNFYWGGFSIADLKGAKVRGLRRMGKVVVIDLVSKDLGPAALHPHPTSSSALSSFMLDKSFDSFKKEELVAGARWGAPSRVTQISVVIHLKLTGQLIYQDKKTRVQGGHPIPPLNLPAPNKSTRVIFAFTNGGHLYFNDIRKFGWVKIVRSDDESIKKAIGQILGPDPLEMTEAQFLKLIGGIKSRRPQATIKKLLMDQTFVAGVGNIYSDEALWRAKIHPKRALGFLSDADFKAIFKGIVGSFKLAIEKGGSSANSFVDGRGEKGLYLTFAKAYHRTGEPCGRCGTKIVREKMDGRSAHYCPKCQVLSHNSSVGRAGQLELSK